MQWHMPIGYKVVDGKITICEEQRKIVEQIFTDYDSGVAAGRIAQNLKGRNICNAKGKVSWTHASIGRILENPSYLGTEYYPQLIGEELFERVQRRREKVRAELGRADHRPGRDERILFGGVIWCAECGAVCSHIQPNHKKERGGTAKWKCRNYVTGRAKNCRNSFITDGQAKQVCVEAINAVIRNKGLLRVHRQEEKVSPQYRVLERNLQRMKEEQERTETDLMKLLYERAEERYRHWRSGMGSSGQRRSKTSLQEKRNWKRLMKIYIEK